MCVYSLCLIVTLMYSGFNTIYEELAYAAITLTLSALFFVPKFSKFLTSCLGCLTFCASFYLLSVNFAPLKIRNDFAFLVFSALIFISNSADKTLRAWSQRKTISK